VGELFDRITAIDNLKSAWLRVAANRGAPGVDEVSIARFARHWEENLYHLRDALRANTYRPSRLRHFFVPKASGGSRRIGILTVTDRIAQRAALNVLDQVYEPRFLPCSYGYRPRRSVVGAVQAVVAQRDRGRRWLLDADIEAFFDSLDRALLLARLGEAIHEPQVLRLVDLWLHAMPFGRGKAKGVALGAVESKTCEHFAVPLRRTHDLEKLCIPFRIFSTEGVGEATRRAAQGLWHSLRTVGACGAWRGSSIRAQTRARRLGAPRAVWGWPSFEDSHRQACSPAVLASSMGKT